MWCKNIDDNVTTCKILYKNIKYLFSSNDQHHHLAKRDQLKMRLREAKLKASSTCYVMQTFFIKSTIVTFIKKQNEKNKCHVLTAHKIRPEHGVSRIPDIFTSKRAFAMHILCEAKQRMGNQWISHLLPSMNERCCDSEVLTRVK